MDPLPGPFFLLFSMASGHHLQGPPAGNFIFAGLPVMPERSRVPRQRRLAAVVLSRVNYREADLIVTFLTRELGLVSALARYGRRSMRRFGGGLLSPGMSAWYDFTIKPGSSLAFVEKGEENLRAPRLPADPVVQSLAAFALELVRGFEAPDNPAEESFNLLLKHLGRLSRYGQQTETEAEMSDGENQPEVDKARRRVEAVKALRLISLDFALKYLELAGFGPRLTGCLMCGNTPEPASGWRWSPMAGGLYCPNCVSQSDRRSRPVARALLSRLGPRQPGTCLPPLGEAELAEAELFFEKLAEHHLSHSLKAMKAARQLFKK